MEEISHNIMTAIYVKTLSSQIKGQLLKLDFREKIQIWYCLQDTCLKQKYVERLKMKEDNKIR